MSGILKENKVSASSQIKFTSISGLSPEVEHGLKVDCDGGWSILLNLPERPIDEEPWHMGLFLCPSPTLLQKFQRNTSLAITMTFTLKYLSGEIFSSLSSSSLNWLPGQVDNGFSAFANWRELWCNNPPMQRDDGFLVLLELDSLPGFGSPSINPPLLRTISSLCYGEDFSDTKFWVFSRRRVVRGSVGARVPKPIYANSRLLESQSEYFATSKHSLIFAYLLLLTLRSASHIHGVIAHDSGWAR